MDAVNPKRSGKTTWYNNNNNNNNNKHQLQQEQQRVAVLNAYNQHYLHQNIHIRRQ
jgi:hypothetical protein